MPVYNAIIENVVVGLHKGIVTIWLQVTYGAATQGFGGYVCYNPTYSGRDCTGEFIYKVLHVLEKENLHELIGAPVRIKKNTSLGQIVSVGHFIKENWFTPETDLSM